MIPFSVYIGSNLLYLIMMLMLITSTAIPYIISIERMSWASLIMIGFTKLLAVHNTETDVIETKYFESA